MDTVISIVTADNAAATSNAGAVSTINDLCSRLALLGRIYIV